jgi:hypothetical protein
LHLSFCTRKTFAHIICVLSLVIDNIRCYLPKYSAYLQACSPDQVDALTQKECGNIAETLISATLQAGRSATLHCQLCDSDCYKHYIQHFLRNQFSSLKLALLHSVADQDVARVQSQMDSSNRHICCEQEIDAVATVERRFSPSYWYEELCLCSYRARD